MSGEVQGPSSDIAERDPDAIPGDMVAVGVRVNGEVVKYSWPLDSQGVSMEATPFYNLARDRKPLYTDVVIRFRFPG